MPSKKLMVSGGRADTVLARRLMAASMGVLWLVLGAAQPAFAAASPWWENEHGAVRLIAASDAAGAEEEVRFGLHFRMRPGWKIYWRSPGDAGFPPRPDWAGSENMAEARIDWPAPHRFSVIGLETLGYKNEVVLPVTVTPFESGKTIRLRARVPYLTCADICVPYEAKLALDLPAGPGSSAREAALIDLFAALVPARGPGAGLSIVDAEVVGEAPSQIVQIGVVSDRPLGAPDVYVEGPRGYGFAVPRVQKRAAGRGALMRVAVAAPKGNTKSIVGEKLTFTVVDGKRAVEQTLVLALGAATEAPPPWADRGPSMTLIAILGLALLGGLILNLMPCVLPVLSLKLLAVVGHGGGDSGPVRIGFIASAAGIVVSFLVLGTGAVALKWTGLTAGWGIQFQQPLFLAVMTIIVVLFACNLWGLFEIRLPGAIADSAAGAAVGVGAGHGLRGHFLTGAFAALLATPCSAPFLGTAVGFALARGAAEIYAVFAALGVGLALPYLAVAAFPALATRLPRPGPWMVTLRRILGFALLATGVWLLGVLATQSGYIAAVTVALAMAGVVVTIWRLRVLPPRSRRIAWAVVAALGALSLVAAGTVAEPDRALASADIEDLWQPFDADAIAREIALSRIVFVDVTADWCITCQVNKVLVLNKEDVRARLSHANVTAMQADWTRPDPAITDFLASFGRYGIPFDVVFGPGSPAGEPLPEILTRDAVIGALERAGVTSRPE